MTTQNLIENQIKPIILAMGFEAERVNLTLEDEGRRLLIMIDDDLVRGRFAPNLLYAFNHLINQLFKKHDLPYCVVDLNFYRKERERLIVELTRAAAKKAMMTKQEIDLPPMNAYERRIVHSEIAFHPELTTESQGEGKARHVVIKHLNAES